MRIKANKGDSNKGDSSEGGSDEDGSNKGDSNGGHPNDSKHQTGLFLLSFRFSNHFGKQQKCNCARITRVMFVFALVVWDRAWSRFQTASVFVTDHKDILKFIAGIAAFWIGYWKVSHYYGKMEDKADDKQRVALESQREYEDTQREKLFEIAEPQVPRHKLERSTKANAWKNFIYANLLNSPSIYWIYGAKRVGKSTMLQQYTFTLQTELGAGKIEGIEKYDWADDLKAASFRVFYINLEKRGADEMDTRRYVRDLVHQIQTNERDGKMSLVVVGMFFCFV